MRRFASSLLLVLCGTFLGALLGLVARHGIESLLAMAVVGTIVAAVVVELGPRAWSLLVTRLPVELRSPITRRGRDTISPQETGALEDLTAPPDFQAIHTGSSVTLEVTNSGPAALFRAEVIEVRGTEDDNAGVTPWAIRWRDSTEGDQRGDAPGRLFEAPDWSVLRSRNRGEIAKEELWDEVVALCSCHGRTVFHAGSRLHRAVRPSPDHSRITHSRKRTVREDSVGASGPLARDSLRRL